MGGVYKMAVGPGHLFYVRLNEVLDGEGFDEFAEKLCALYAGEVGASRPIFRGIYFSPADDWVFRRASSLNAVSHEQS